MSSTSGKMLGHHGFAPPGLRPDYKTYRSPHAPQYTIGANFHGISYGRLGKFALTAAAFGGAAGVAGVFFLSDVPRFRKDIMQNIPIIGGYYIREVAPEDNPF